MFRRRGGGGGSSFILSLLLSTFTSFSLSLFFFFFFFLHPFFCLSLSLLNSLFCIVFLSFCLHLFSVRWVKITTKEKGTKVTSMVRAEAQGSRAHRPSKDTLGCVPSSVLLFSFPRVTTLSFPLPLPPPGPRDRGR